MKRKILKITILSLIAVFSIGFIFSIPLSIAQEGKGKVVCGVYISGDGCHNCAVTDPILFQDFTKRFPNLVLIEYEIYKSAIENREAKTEYFSTYLGGRGGVPFLIFNKEHTFLGRLNVPKAGDWIATISQNPCPMADGSSIAFENIDISSFPGKINIWTKNRVLLSNGGDTSNKDNKEILKELILAKDVTEVLKKVKHRVVDPIPVEISLAEINFDHAAIVGGWRLQWNGDYVDNKEGSTTVSLKKTNRQRHLYKSKHRFSTNTLISILLGCIGILLIFAAFIKVKAVEQGLLFSIRFDKRSRDFLIAGVSSLLLMVFFILAPTISPDALARAGYRMPLPLFTFFIALIDGFNPCNIFVLICLLSVIISTSESRMRLYTVAFSFVFMVYIIYFLFMAAWLKVFQLMNFVTPLRIGIAFIALVAGLINCKELLFFRKGITLTIQDKHKGPLLKRITAMRTVIAKGSYPVLILSSIGLATLASLVELPCTAGFPIIFTGILSAKSLANTWIYYLYIAFYNIIYVMPLMVIVAIFIYTFRTHQITERQVQIIKFIGGLIMVLLGIILLVNPALIGIPVIQ